MRSCAGGSCLGSTSGSIRFSSSAKDVCKDDQDQRLSKMRLTLKMKRIQPLPVIMILMVIMTYDNGDDDDDDGDDDKDS